MNKKSREPKNKSVGETIRSMRTKMKVSLGELSDKTGIPVPRLDKIEEGSGFTPVGDMLKIARALTIDPTELFQSGKEREKELEKKRVLVFKKREEAYQYEVLTPAAVKDHLRAFRVVIPANAEHPGVSYQHDGEEFVYVLKGEVDVRVGHKNTHLVKDGSIHFNSGITHALKNPGKTDAILIVTLYTP